MFEVKSLDDSLFQQSVNNYNLKRDIGGCKLFLSRLAIFAVLEGVDSEIMFLDRHY